MSKQRRRNSLLSRPSSKNSRSKKRIRESRGPLPKITKETMRTKDTEKRGGALETSALGAGLRTETEEVTPNAPDMTAAIREDGMMTGLGAMEIGLKEKRMEIGTDLKSEDRKREGMIMPLTGKLTHPPNL